jgi:hypothetical protein
MPEGTLQLEHLMVSTVGFHLDRGVID